MYKTLLSQNTKRSLFFILMMLIGGYANAENAKTFLSSKVNLLKTRIEDKDQIQQRKNLTYFVNEMTPYSGVAIDKKNNCIISSENYKKGVKNGEQLYYESGSCGTMPEKILNFKNGKLDGKQAKFYKNGRTQVEIIFEERVVKIVLYFENGQIWHDTRIVAKDKGTINKEKVLQMYLISKKYRLNEWFDPSGSFDPEMYSSGDSFFAKELGFVTYYPNGMKSAELEFRDGKVLKDKRFDHNGEEILTFLERDTREKEYEKARLAEAEEEKLKKADEIKRLDIERTKASKREKEKKILAKKKKGSTETLDVLKSKGTLFKREHFNDINYSAKEMLLPDSLLERNEIWSRMLETAPRFQKCYQDFLDKNSTKKELVLMLRYSVSIRGIENVSIDHFGALQKSETGLLRCTAKEVFSMNIRLKNDRVPVVIHTPLSLHSQTRSGT